MKKITTALLMSSFVVVCSPLSAKTLDRETDSIIPTCAINQNTHKDNTLRPINTLELASNNVFSAHCNRQEVFQNWINAQEKYWNTSWFNGSYGLWREQTATSYAYMKRIDKDIDTAISYLELMKSMSGQESLENTASFALRPLSMLEAARLNVENTHITRQQAFESWANIQEKLSKTTMFSWQNRMIQEQEAIAKSYLQETDYQAQKAALYLEAVIKANGEYDTVSNIYQSLQTELIETQRSLFSKAGESFLNLASCTYTIVADTSLKGFSGAAAFGLSALESMQDVSSEVFAAAYHKGGQYQQDLYQLLYGAQAD